jgi:hypothetical protein
MAYKRNKLEEAEYQFIKRTYRLSRVANRRRTEEETIDLVSVQCNRSPQTVTRVVNTPNYRRYKLQATIERRRHPVSTLGKRVNNIERILMASGALPMEKA